jgi:hypothetical protein
LRASFDAFVVPFGCPPILEVPGEGSVSVVLLDSVREKVGIILISVAMVLHSNAALTGDVLVIPDTSVW